MRYTGSQDYVEEWTSKFVVETGNETGTTPKYGNGALMGTVGVAPTHSSVALPSAGSCRRVKCPFVRIQLLLIVAATGASGVGVLL